MKNKKTFPIGGISLPKFKLSSNTPIKDAGLPEYVYIPIKQHIGAPAKILVSKGDGVKVGTLLADADGIISSDVHSSVSGTIEKIEETKADTGYLEVMITIKVEGDEYEPHIDLSKEIKPEINDTSEEIIKKIRGAGIVGMGGAGFPTPVKTSVPQGKSIDTFIINGIECEPYLTSDDRLMLEYAEEIIIGAKIINKALGIQNAIIAIDENKKSAIDVMQRICKRYVGVNVAVCKTMYPQGAEKQLIKAITKKEVPTGKLPIDVNCLVHNVATVYAIYEAVQKNKPLYQRVVTISGDLTSTPSNLMTRVGTPASFLYNQCGGINKNVGQVIFGGPMMGKSLVNIDAPTTKLTSGILLLSHELTNKAPEENCIRCAKCAHACCMGLEPYKFSRAIKNNDTAQIKKLNALSCTECGTCSYICPARIPLLDYVKLAKKATKKT